jgi:outer membrane protein insertion porin family
LLASAPTPFRIYAGRMALSAVLLALGMTGLGHAQEADQDEAPEKPEATPAAPVATRITSITVEGSKDPPGNIENLIATVAPANVPFVESGEADRVGNTPLGTVPRLFELMKAVGYHAKTEVVPQGDGVSLHVQLRPMDRIRLILVSGNFLRGIRQEDVLRQLSLRNGQALPPAGPRRDALFEAETARVRDYLRSQGHQEAEVTIIPHSTKKVPATVNLDVRVRPGPGYRLGKIMVTGNNAMSTDDIDSSLRHRDWHTIWITHQPFQRMVLRNDETDLARRYTKLGYPGVRISDDFDPITSVDHEDKTVHLQLTVKERRRIELAFEGNHVRSDAGLRNELEKGVYDDVDATEASATLEKSYRERGHMLAKVTWRRQRLDENADRITFTVDEGPVLKVRGVEFVGNHRISSSTLQDEIRTKEYPFLGAIGLGEGGLATPRQIELDVQSLVDYYETVGHPDTKVVAEMAPRPGEWHPLPPTGGKTIVPAEDEALWHKASALYVRFTIQEAPLVRVADMRFVSLDPNTPLPRDDAFMRKCMRTVVGEPYQPATIRRDETRLKRLMGDEGFLFATVEAKIDRKGDQVHLTWNITPGTQTRVGSVFIRGNFQTTDDTIMTWAEIQPGDMLTTRAIERAQRNLAMIQLFNNPNPISFPSESPHAPVVPMVVDVEERHDHFGIISVGGGISTDQKDPNSNFPFGYFVSAGYEHRNLFGHAWTLTSRGDYGPSLTRANVSLLDPRFFGSLFRLELGGNYFRQATVRLGDLRSGAAFIGFAREMYPGVDANVRYNFRNTYHTEDLTRSAGADEDQKTDSIGTMVGSFSSAIEWQRLDNLLVPTRGFKVGAGVEVALPAFSFDQGGDSFVKLNAHSLAVAPLTSWLTLRYSLRFDQGFPLGGASLLPRVERYFAGGDTTLRGYDLDRALTDAVETEIAPGINGVRYQPVGGNLRVLQNIDLQFPVARPWYGSVFLDSGVVAFSLDGLQAKQFRHGVGVAPFVFKLPIGDLSLAFAIPLNRRPGDSTWRFHVNVGLMF